ncbi:LacI family DNA-binding transcriptional regulator [Pelagicoccus sp. SDUM812003]|uniref:LacI family DNA-binding transcriptional regulator n=1 Tax=Pelagicoccus sp. SDUM812003 TaxID=3041267 RepID=UPI00280C6B03|nr:LacI family DNA-binding transcriptional regulator [Pelagicoccus sp. SDUM812003]MDQ8205242.1 LacI family DNA-binding transcriptional regulator [Pelagicoccus sp. SDUM812003]
MAKVSQQLIADQLNICRTTVSRCFSNRAKINPETRAKVLELAAQLGYRYTPQRTRKGKRVNRATEIGVLIASSQEMIELPFPSQYLLKGVSERAASLDLSLDVRYVDPAELDVLVDTNRTPKGLRRGSGAWDGAVLIFPFTPETVARLSSRLPTVSIAEDYSDAGIDSIDVDHHAGIQKVVTHLAELGHTRIGFVSWRYSVENPWVFRRFGAFVDSLYRHGLPFDPQLALNVRKGQNIETADLAAEVAKRSRGGATAWVCAADHQAYRLIADLRKHAISVPEDCAITGFDGIAPPPGMPMLTSIKVPLEEMGASAVTRLLDRINNPSAHRRHNLVEGRIVQGHTTRPLPAYTVTSA